MNVFIIFIWEQLNRAKILTVIRSWAFLTFYHCWFFSRSLELIMWVWINTLQYNSFSDWCIRISCSARLSNKQNIKGLVLVNFAQLQKNGFISHTSTAKYESHDTFCKKKMLPCLCCFNMCDFDWWVTANLQAITL